MNRIYRTVWNYATQSLVVVSELAKSNKKASAGSNVSEVNTVNSLSKGKLLAVAGAMSAILLTGGQAMAATKIVGKNGCEYNTKAESVICGDASTSVEDVIDKQYSWNSQEKQARSVVIGQQTTSVGESNVAIGTGAKIEQFTQPGVKVNTPSNAVHQLGTTYKPQASVAIGDGAIVKHSNAIAIGDDATANSFRDIAIGMQAGVGSKNAGSVGNNILLGNQAGNNIQSHNLVAIGTNAGTGLGNKIGTDTGFVHSNVAIGVNANSTAAVKVAAATTQGLSGVSANAENIIANNTVAVGNLSLANQSGSTALGYYARSTGATSSALGFYTAVSGANSLAAGSYAFTSGESSIAIGHLANTSINNNKAVYAATGDQSIAIGANTRTPAKNSIAIGANAAATLDDSVALGAGSKTDVAAVATNSATVNGVTYTGFAGNNPTSVISVGTTGKERQIKHVAAGVISATSTDAINGSQLYLVMNEVAKPLSFSADSGPVVTPAQAGTVSINGDHKNITTKTTSTGVQVELNNVIDVGGVKTDFVAIKYGPHLSKNKLDMNNAPITNMASAFPIDPATGKKYTSLVAVNQAIADGVLDPSVLGNAVNLGDLQQQANINVEINNNIFGKDRDGNPFVNKDGSITSAGRAALRTYNVDERGTQERNGIFNAIKNMNEQGIKFFHTNDGVVRSVKDGTSEDDSAANAAYSTAIGYRAEVEKNAVGALAIGNGAIAKSAGSVAIGEQSEADQAHVAAGTPESAYSVNGANEDAVAGKATAATKVLSVGKVGAERQIQNVAAGVVSATSTDAVNGSQLYQTNKAVAANTRAIEKLRGDVHNMDRKLRAGIAGAVATAGLPQAYTPGKNMVAAAAGTYKGETAVALGVSRISDNGKVVLKLTGNANSRGDVGASVGAGYQW